MLYYFHGNESEVSAMNKVEEIMELVKAHDIKELKDYFNKKEEAEKRNNTIIWIFAIIGVIAAVAGVAYLLYRYFTPDYLEDFDDDFDLNLIEKGKKPARQANINIASPAVFQLLCKIIPPITDNANSSIGRLFI